MITQKFCLDLFWY